jgi:hypothetical protein
MTEKILCPTCERETDGVMSGSETDSDGYLTETYQCYECMEIFDRITMPKDTHLVVCHGCAAAWTIKAHAGGRLAVRLTCQCGTVTEYDSDTREAMQHD